MQYKQIWTFCPNASRMRGLLVYRTNFEINSFICSKDITGVPKLPIWSRDPGHASFGDSVVNPYERVYDATFFLPNLETLALSL